MTDKSQEIKIAINETRLERIFPHFLAIIAFFVPLVFYIFTMAPGITMGDAGELIAATAGFGVPHPPGFPTWTFLTHFFTKIPLSSIAWRVNFASGVYAAASCLVLFLVTREVLSFQGVRGGKGVKGAGDLIALGVALTFGFSRTLWANAVVAEVYSLMVLCMLATFYSTLLWEKHRQLRFIFLAGLCCSLGLGVHYQVALVFPGLAAFVGVSVLGCGSNSGVKGDKRGKGGKKDMIVGLGKLVSFGLGGVTAGLLVFAYLPLAARAHPVINWGNPSTLENFWFHILRKKYTVHDVNLGVMVPYFKLSAEQGILGRILVSLKSFFAIYWWEFGVLGVLVLPGIVSLGRRLFPEKPRHSGFGLSRASQLFLNSKGFDDRLDCARPLCLRLSASYLLFFALVFMAVLGFLYLSKPAVPARDTPFFDQLLGFSLLLPLVGVGAYSLCNYFNNPKIKQAVVGVSLIAPVILLIANYKDSNWSQNRVGEYFVADILATAPQNATLLFDGDPIFPVLYAVKVEGQRPDISFYDRTGNIDPYAYKVPHSNIITDSAAYAKARFDQESVILENAPAGVYLAVPEECSQGFFYNGILSVSKADPAQPVVDFEKDYQNMLSIKPTDIANDPYGQLMVASYHLRLGYQTLQRATQSLISSSSKDNLTVEELNLFVSSKMAEDETYKKAYQLTQDEFEKAASFGPSNSNLLNMVAACYAGIGHQEKAMQMMEELYILNPEYAWVNYNLGLFYSRTKDYDKAVFHLQKTLALNDNFFLRAGEQLGYVYLGQKKNQEAVDILKQVYDLNPETQNAQLNYGLGLAYLKLKQYNNSAKHLQKSLDIQSENVKALEGLVVNYFNIKQYEKAGEVAHKLLEFDSQNKYGLQVVEKLSQID